MDENNQFQQSQDQQYGQAPQQPQYNQQAGYGQAPQQPQQPQYNQAAQQTQYNQAPQQPQYNQAGYGQAPQGQAPQPPKKKSGMGIVVAILLIIGGLILATVIIFVLLFRAAAKKAGDELDEFATSSEYELMTEYINDLTTESSTYTTTIDEDTFANRNWLEAHDNSYLVPMSGNSFYYYKDKADQTNYYYTGTYEFYVGQEAYDKLTSDEYKDYGIEASELDQMFAMNEQYEKENLVLMVLNSETQMIDGVDQFGGTPVTSPYYGFYYEKDGKQILDLANMNSANYYLFEAE